MSTARSFTDGSLGKQIFKFSIPLMFSNVLQVLFNMSDIAVVGRFAGSSALGSVGSTTTLVTLFTGFLMGMGSGVNALTARFFGGKNERELKETIHTSAIICLIIGALILILGLTMSGGFLRILNTKDDLIEGAKLYLKIYFLGMPAMAIFNYGNAVLSAIGDTKTPLIYLSIAGVINIILNLFFVIVCKLSVAGVAIASVISQYISAFLIIRLLMKSKEIYSLKLSELHITKARAFDVLRIGIPTGCQYALFQIANLFIQAGVNSFDSVVVKGNSAAANADTLVYDIMAAFYTACSSFIGQNFGAGQKKRVLKSYLVSLAFSFCAGLFFGLLFVFFGRQFLELFTTEAEVAQAAMMRLRIMGFCYCVTAFMDCATAACRGIGKSIVPMIIIIIGSCILRIVWIYTVFAYFHTITSLYLVYLFTWTVTAIAENIYFAYSYKRLPVAVNV